MSKEKLKVSQMPSQSPDNLSLFQGKCTARGVARISKRRGSKLVPTKMVGLKTLHYIPTRLWRLRFRKQKTPWLPLSERYLCLDGN